jgi:hypothetical protein
MQCPKRLWLEVNRRDLLSVPPELQRRFDEGHRVNDVVHRLMPDGHLIGPEVTLSDALKFTSAQLARHPDRPLFEATFSKHRVLVRADVFQQRGGVWRLTEVKSSTGMKPYHLADCAVQLWVIRDAGYPVEDVRLAHVDTTFVYRGDGNYTGLLHEADVTADAEALQAQVPDWVAQCFEALGGPEPAVEVGPQCTDPFDCPFVDHCSPPPPEYPVTLLPNGGNVVNELLAAGINDVRNIPAGRLARPLHQRVYRATLTGQPYVSPDLATTLNGLGFPRYYLDFETIQFAVPVWADTHPYEQLPFQWSCHIEAADGALRHEEFLDLSGEAPMRACAQGLIETLGSTGPILTYSHFERTQIRNLAARFPDLKEPLSALLERLVDLLPVVRNHYYHPAMKGSFSIKAVLPVVAPHLSYAALGEVNNGVAAQIAFEEAIDPATDTARRGELEQQMLAYCGLDTLAMVELVRALAKAAPSEPA